VDKRSRSERVVTMTKILCSNPYRLFSLGYFMEMFGTAKSTVSEDLAVVRTAMEDSDTGQVVTVAGAAGGVRYIPRLGKAAMAANLERLAQQLAVPERVIPGGYLYMADLICDPAVAAWIGEAFATVFANRVPDYVVTIETKGIPLALMTARALGVPMVVIRDEGKVTEGSAVSINYTSGSTRRIRTMALARRALPLGARVLLIDDFMKAGGTARGMQDLMAEFHAAVLGIGVLVSTTEPVRKMVEDYVSLLELAELDEQDRRVHLRPGRLVPAFARD